MREAFPSGGTYPGVNDAVGERESDGVAEGVILGLAPKERLDVPVGEGEAVVEGVSRGVIDGDGEEASREEVSDGEVDEEPLKDGVREGVGDGLCVWSAGELVGVTESDMVVEGVRDGVTEEVAMGRGEGEEVEAPIE